LHCGLSHDGLPNCQILFVIHQIIGRGTVFQVIGYATTAAKVEAEAAAATEAVAASEETAQNGQGLEPGTGESKVEVGVLRAELLGDEKAEAAVIVVDGALFLVGENAVSVRDLAESVGGRWVVGILIGMMLESQLAISPPYLLGSCLAIDAENEIQRFAGCGQLSLSLPRRRHGFLDLSSVF